MRLTSRFLALILLIVIAVFSNLVSSVSKADDLDTCSDNCLAVLQQCNTDCHGDSSCQNACIQEDKKCVAKCKAPVEEPPQN
jgi:hypothetical protein